LFEVVSSQSSQDGAFVVRDFRIEPSNIQIVLGDIHLMTQDPPQDLKIYSSLAPLVAPNELVEPKDIGKDGRFPGLWAVDLTPGQGVHSFAPGTMFSGIQKEIRLRFAPAVTGVLGIKSEKLRGYTLLFDAHAQRDQTRCSLEVRLAFEGGIGQRISFLLEDGKKYKNTIQINYASWFKDIDFNALCSKSAVKINKNENQQSASFIRNAILHSIKFTFAETQ